MSSVDDATTYGDYQPPTNDNAVVNGSAEMQPTDTETPSEEPASAGTLNALPHSEGTANGGAPSLNLNHGGDMLNSDPEIGRQRLILGKLPPSLARVERATNAFRTALEDAFELAYGNIDLVAAATIQTACKWERHSMLATRWLRDEAERMDASERLAYSREIARASAERDKAIAALKLGAARKTIAETLYPMAPIHDVPS